MCRVLQDEAASDAPVDSEFLQTTAAVVLAKPLGIDALVERIRRLLTTR